MSVKATNPKEAVGTAKPPLSTVSGPVLAELGVAMMEGSRKYGRHNYRVSGVRFSTYYDACFRHMVKCWEGEDIDPDSGLSHVTKAIATLFVLRDAMIQGQVNDDRPPKSPAGFFTALEAACKAVIAKYPDSKEAFTEIGQKTGQRSPIMVQCHGCGNTWDVGKKSECQCRPVPDHEIKLDELPITGDLQGCAVLPVCKRCDVSVEPMLFCHHCNFCDDHCKCI
jgi:hypothetical protein